MVSRLLVNTDAARPNMVLLDRSMISSMLLNFMICCTGPNICDKGNGLISICGLGGVVWLGGWSYVGLIDDLVHALELHDLLHRAEDL